MKKIPLPIEAKFACIEYLFTDKIKTLNMYIFKNIQDLVFSKIPGMSSYGLDQATWNIVKDPWAPNMHTLEIHFQGVRESNGASWEIIVEYFLHEFTENLTSVRGISWEGVDKIWEI